MPLGKVGDDAAGAFVLREMRAVGIDTRFVEVVAGNQLYSASVFSIRMAAEATSRQATQRPPNCRRKILIALNLCFKLSVQRPSRYSCPRYPSLVGSISLPWPRRKGAFSAASFVSAEIADAKRLGMFDQLSLVSLNEDEAADLVGEPFTPGGPEVFSGQALSPCRLNVSPTWGGHERREGWRVFH